jgi:thioredoxin 1
MNKPSATLIQVTEQDFTQQVLEADVPVLVDFWAEWCGPCRALGPVIESLSGQYEERAKIVKVDIDSNQQLAMKYGIRSIPTVMLFDKGQVEETFVGVRPRTDYEAGLARILRELA